MKKDKKDKIVDAAMVTLPDSLQEALKWAPASTPHTRELALRRNLSKSIESYLISGMVLCMAEDKQDWREAKCKNHFEWVENEQRLSRTHAQRMQLVWRKLSKYLPSHYDSILKIPFMNLVEVARVAHMIDEIKLIELMDNAAVNTERGFKDNIRELEGKVPPQDKCDHINKQKVVTTVEVCMSCGKAFSKKEEKFPVEEKK